PQPPPASLPTRRSSDLRGSSGNDFLVDQEGANNVLEGGAGDDTIAGNNQMNGGSGNDSLNVVDSIHDVEGVVARAAVHLVVAGEDRKRTRLNSSHSQNS